MYSVLSQKYPEMPDDVWELYRLLAGEAISLEAKLEILTLLHRPSEKDAILLRGAGRNMQRHIVAALRDYMVTSIFRFLDCAGNSDGDENISLKSLRRRVNQSDPTKDDSALARAWKNLEEIKKNIVIHRMKRTAHASLSFSREIESGEAPAIGLNDFRSVLDGIEKFLDECRLFYVDSGFIWEVSMVHGPRTFMTKLAMAEQFHELMVNWKIEGEDRRWERWLED
jgi:hypothetical protein